MAYLRFAPSPTGLLHVGNVRTALINWLYAKSLGGSFLLRIDNTDRERSKEEYTQGIKQELTWLGITWDEYAEQIDRVGRYSEIVQQLTEAGRLYPCFETQEELEVKRKLQLGRGQPPIYDRAALNLTQEQIEQYKAEGKKPHWRFKLADSTISWEDQVRGTITFEGKHLSDPILIRECGTPTYMLPSVIDDMDMHITHIVRGEDHISNTAIQLQLFEALEAKMPQFAHLSLIKSKEDKISKRKGGFDIESLRTEEGIDAMAINSLLAKIGSSDPIELRNTMEELIAEFDISKFSKAQANYDLEELKRLNSKRIHQLSYEDVKPQLAALGLQDVDEAFWLAVRPNIMTMHEISTWWECCCTDISPEIAEEDKAFLTQAATLLPAAENWNDNTYQEWTALLKEQTGRKGKQLFMPLRKALTGQEHGPELKVVLQLLGYDKAYARLYKA